jgi:hypothetical protein
MMRGPCYSLRALDLLNARAKRHRRRTNHRGARIIGVTMLVKWGCLGGGGAHGRRQPERRCLMVKKAKGIKVVWTL